MSNRFDRTGEDARILGGERLLQVGMFLSRHLPRWIVYGIAKWGGRLMGWLFPGRRAILESNLEPVLPDAAPRYRRKVAVEIFAHALRSYYEMLYVTQVSPEEIATMVTFEEPGWSWFKQSYQAGQGIVLVMTHQSSFDLAGQALAARGFHLFALVLPDISGGFGYLNELRVAQQVRALPVGPRAVREAMRALCRGGVLVVAGDRPINDQGTEVTLFGRPTVLPDGHVRLALRTGAEMALSVCRLEEGAYRVRMQPVELARTGDREADVRENVQRVARAIEPAIRAHPEQWHLFRRLWD